MSENRKCVNCRHRILNEATTSNKCEIDGHRIDYAECFDGWCRHWAKQKPLTDEELAKIKFEDLIPLVVIVGVFGDSLKDKKEQTDD